MLRLGLAQFKPGKGDYGESLDRIGSLLGGLAGRKDAPELLVFPEAALTGYLLEGGVRDLAVTAGQLFQDLLARHAAAKAPRIDIAIGFYEKWRGSLYNSALYATLGGSDARILHVHRKVFLPTYGVFDEERFVESGHGIQAFDTRFGRIGVLICEDAWHSLTPTIAAIQGAQLIVIHSASPARGTQPLEETVPRPANVSRRRIASDSQPRRSGFRSSGHGVGTCGINSRSRATGAMRSTTRWPGSRLPALASTPRRCTSNPHSRRSTTHARFRSASG